MGFRNFLREYFTFNRRERNGVFVLMGIILLLLFYLSFSDLFYSKEKMDFTDFEQEISRFQTELKRTEDSISEARSHFSFSGNTLVEDSGQRSGWERTRYDKKQFSRELVMVELNSADTTELKKIRGIGSVFAKRIVKFRDALGGFNNRSQLREVYGVDEQKFNEINTQIILDSLLVKKLNVNTASVEDLSMHPYISKKEAVAIFAKRVKTGDFLDFQEIKKVTLMSDTSFIKILPYLSIL